MSYVPPVGGDVGTPADITISTNNVVAVNNAAAVNHAAILNLIGYAYAAVVWAAAAWVLVIATVAIPTLKEIFDSYDISKFKNIGGAS